MRKILAIAFILCSAFTMAQTEGCINEPQKIESIVKVRKPLEWYVLQSKLWEQRVMADTGNEAGWQNWLKALHYAATMNEERADESLIKERDRALEMLKKKCPNTATRYMMELWIKGPFHPDCEAISDKLLAAIKENPDRVEFYGN